MDSNKIKDSVKKNSILWNPTSYFAMGLPFVVLYMITILKFKGLEVEDKITTFMAILLSLLTLNPLRDPCLIIFKTKRFLVTITQLITNLTFDLTVYFALFRWSNNSSKYSLYHPYPLKGKAYIP